MHTRTWLAVVVGGLLINAHSPGAFASPEPDPQKLASPPGGDAAEAARRAEDIASFEVVPGARETITLGELEDAIVATGGLRSADRAAVKAVLDRTVRLELLAAEAARRGYDKSASVVQSVKQNAVQSMIKQDIDSKVTPDAVPADAVAKYYKEHLSEFVRPELRRASQIVLPTEDEAKAVLEQAKSADMRAFRELARLKSRDETTKLRGGDLRYFDAKGNPDPAGSNIDPAIAKATFALKTAGDTSGVLETDAGFVIVKLTGVRPPHDEKLKAAEERIRMRLWREQREAAIDALLVTLKQASPPVIHPELLDRIDFGPDPAGPPNAGLPTGFPHTKPPAAPNPKP